jgi:hypothetical protein
MGWSRQRLYDELGLGRSRGAEYLKPGTGNLSTAPFDRLVRRYGWPRRIFEDGGPMPSVVVNRPVNDPGGRWAGYLRQLPFVLALGGWHLAGFLEAWAREVREEAGPADPGESGAERPTVPLPVHPFPASG